MDRILPLFDTHTPQRGQFLYPERGKKQTFVHGVIESPLRGENRLLHIRGCPIIFWTGLNIKIGIDQKVYE